MLYKAFIQNNLINLSRILDCLKVGVYITDGKGDTLLLNEESCKTGGLSRDEVLGKNMNELERIGFVENSVSLKALSSGKEEEIIQNLGDGGSVYVTGTPLFYDGKIDLVISTERNITETLTLKKLLQETNESNVKIKQEVEYLKMQNIVMWGNLIAEDESSKELVDKALRLAKVDTTVLLMGPSGTGKEVFANFIYKNSQRDQKPFIKVNCAAIPENLMESELFGYEGGAFTGADKHGKMGIFEMANQGTIFLDEIGEIPLHLQSKLLRVLQEKEIRRVGGTKVIPLNIRLIAATNKDLKEAVQDGSFRGDLYYRLSVMPIELLPLVGRKKDIKALVISFLDKFNKEYRISKTITEESIEALQDYDWPGNIRELENVIERMIISFDGDTITKFQVQRALGTKIRDEQDVLLEKMEGKTFQELMDAHEKLILSKMMKKYGKAGTVGELLQLNKTTLWRKIKKYQL